MSLCCLGKGLVRALVLVYRASARACAHVVSEPCWERRMCREISFLSSWLASLLG